MIVLGIESTAHTFSIGIFDGKKQKILANVRDTFVTEIGGMIPNEVKDHHIEVKDDILKKTLAEAKLTMDKVDLISFSQGPGLAPSLVVGRDFAINLSKDYDKKLIGVNHITAHLEIGLYCSKAKNPVFLFCSGANTQIIAHEGGKYRVFGEALSIAIGNALDKFARKIGLGFPGGPKVEELAKTGKLVELPYRVKGMDVDFSGIVNKATNLYKKGVSKEDLCYSMQETCFAMLIEVTERALAHLDKEEVLLIGGVAANKRFSEMLHDMCQARGATAYTVPLEYSGDQGAMIAYLGWLQRDKKQTDFDFNPRWRIDQVDTFWKK